MGFLKFLNKKPKGSEGLGDLDLPPAPPPLEDFHDEDSLNIDIPKMKSMPNEEMEFPSFGEIKDENDLDSLPEMPDLELPPFSSQNQFKPLNEPQKLPEPMMLPPPLPPFPKSSDSKPSKMPAPSPMPMSRRYYGIGKKNYLRLDEFKDVLRDINTIRAYVSNLQSTFNKIDEIESMKDKALLSLSGSMHDLQKKLIYVDKKLMNGGG